jgi:crotonobetainyl-CoA:carnitine CoA-transferase CaiB-like acyl-CoA transferase
VQHDSGGSYDVLGWHTGLTTDATVDTAAPEIGADAAEILAQVGVDPDELAALREAGVVA